MVALPEIDRLLSRAIPAKLEAKVVRGEAVPIARLNGDVELVFGVFGYQRRAIGVPGRLLTTEVTRQPVLAVRERGGITPLPYAEDVTRHPLRDRLEGVLIALCRTR